MKTLAFALVVACTPVSAVYAQQEELDIRQVIQQQFDAFQVDDFATAFTFASPMIEQMFGTPERFGQMVRDGYPMVHRPAHVEFTDLVERGGRLYQNVLIQDAAGVLHLLEYEMIETSQGWEINGVRFKRPGALGA